MRELQKGFWENDELLLINEQFLKKLLLKFNFSDIVTEEKIKHRRNYTI